MKLLCRNQIQYIPQMSSSIEHVPSYGRIFVVIIQITVLISPVENSKNASIRYPVLAFNTLELIINFDVLSSKKNNKAYLM